jgi:hypothetical protein
VPAWKFWCGMKNLVRCDACMQAEVCFVYLHPLILTSYWRIQVTRICFITRPFLYWGFVSTLPNPQARGPPLVGSPRLLIQYTLSYPPHWRLLLQPQAEDAPCCGDRHTYGFFICGEQKSNNNWNMDPNWWQIGMLGVSALAAVTLEGFCDACCWTK